jgi:hypothetical protein
VTHSTRRIVALLCTWLAAHVQAASIGLATFSGELDTRWEYDNPVLSEQRFVSELERWPADDPRNLIVATQVARAQSMRRQVPDAHATLDSVAARLDGMPSLVRVRYLLERARTFSASGTRALAIPLLARALDLATCAGDETYAADAARQLETDGIAVDTTPSVR